MAPPRKAKKPRDKAYKPRPVNAVSAFAAITANLDDQWRWTVLRQQLKHPMDSEETTAISIAHRIAFDALINGRGTKDDWNTIVCTLNTALVLCERGFGPEHEAIMVDALDGVFRAKLRHAKNGKWGFDGPAIQAIKAGFEVHEAQLEIAIQAEVLSALGEVARRVDSGDVYKEAA